MWSRENSCEKYQVIKYGNGMHIDMGIKFSMISVTVKFNRKISCIVTGTGIGMPMYSGNKFFQKIQSLKIQSYQEFPEQCWINITEITMASCGSCPCIH